MLVFMALFTFAEKPVKNAKDIFQRAQKIKQSAEAAGGRLVGVWGTIGYYDFAIVFEAPDDKTAMRYLVESGPQGEPRSFIVRAYSEAEMTELLAALS